MNSRISKLVGITILIANQSDEIVNPVDASSQNGHLDGDSQDVMKWMEMLLYFIISCLKSGRSSHLLDVLVGLQYPVICLQNKEQSVESKKAFISGHTYPNNSQTATSRHPWAAPSSDSRLRTAPPWKLRRCQRNGGR
ncbi:hypothetical protein VNO78_11604 [Psophocarpus tetragonolobus]|uniref:Uncharacterized protein n=1 Tax=Psophocarpus tetragonolobus TaxID=3891 RepID=A0AAN9SMQ5_PSOTE